MYLAVPDVVDHALGEADAQGIDRYQSMLRIIVTVESDTIDPKECRRHSPGVFQSYVVRDGLGDYRSKEVIRNVVRGMAHAVPGREAICCQEVLINPYVHLPGWIRFDQFV